MIIQTRTTFKNYQKEILNKSSGYRGGESHRGIFCCPNDKCRCDKFYRQGTYFRHFLNAGEIEDFPVIDSKNEMESWIFSKKYELVELLRVKCCGCGMTHTILPSDMIPFHQISLPVSLFLCLSVFLSSGRQDSMDSTGSDSMAEKPVIHETKTLSWHFLRCLLIAYALYRQRMISILRYYGLHTAPSDPTDVEILSSYLHGRDSPAALFLQHFRVPLFVTRRNTISYPLRYIIA